MAGSFYYNAMTARSLISRGSGAFLGIDGGVGRYTRRVGDLTGLQAAYSVDGQSIAFTHWNELWVANRDGSAARKIAQAPGAWLGRFIGLHDGKLLRFNLQANTEFRYPLWEAEIQSGKVAALLPERDGATGGAGWRAWTGSRTVCFCKKKGSSGRDNLWRLSDPHRVQQMHTGQLDFSRPAAVPGQSGLAVVGMRKAGRIAAFRLPPPAFHSVSQWHFS